MSSAFEALPLRLSFMFFHIVNTYSIIVSVSPIYLSISKTAKGEYR